MQAGDRPKGELGWDQGACMNCGLLRRGEAVRRQEGLAEVMFGKRSVRPTVE